MRGLAARIGVVALGVSVVFAAIAYVTERNRLQASITELALLQVGRFNQQVIDLIDGPKIPDRVLVQEALERFADASGPTVTSSGYFVLARVFSADGTELAQIVDEGHANISAVNDRVDNARFRELAADEHWSTTVDINGITYIGVAVPMRNSRNEAAAQVVGAFTVSDDSHERMRADVLRTVVYVIAIVLATALAIYPIVGRLLGRLTGLTVNLLDANLETMQVLGGAIAKRDSDTDAHNYRVAVYSVALAQAVALPRDQIRSLIKGALLHDVGKLGIRDDVLLKPGKLDDEEFAVMKTHVEHGLDITARARWLADSADVVGGHHEKFDGSGYPAGLARDDIPINARIFAIADVFDALTSRRPYKDPMPFDAAMDVMAGGRGSHFDPALFDAFADIAAELYAAHGGRDDDSARLRLESLSQTYFRSDIAELVADQE
ncbi:MAG: HD-GYP domain-containing protein [Gammaproteobacteria bacterium]